MKKKNSCSEELDSEEDRSECRRDSGHEKKVIEQIRTIMKKIREKTMQVGVELNQEGQEDWKCDKFYKVEQKIMLCKVEIIYYRIGQCYVLF